MGLISVTQTNSVVWVQAFFQPCDSCVHRYLGKDTQGSSTSSVCRGEDLGAELLKLHRFRRCKVSSIQFNTEQETRSTTNLNTKKGCG